MKHSNVRVISLLLLLCTVSIACNQNDPLMVGGGYGEVLIGSNSLLHQAGNLRLYRFHAFGRRDLIWPYMVVGDRAVMGELIVFNGGASDDRRWLFYPATFAFAGTGSVVELTKPLTRQMSELLAVHTNYAFSVASCTNDIVKFNVIQTLPVDPSRPVPNVIEVEKKVIQAMVAAAHSNGVHSKYDGVPFIIAK